MSTTARVDTLSNIIAQYKADAGQQKWVEQNIAKKNAIIDRFSDITHQFVSEELNLQAFCSALNVAFKEAGESWSAKGHGFMLPMYKISKSHGPGAQARLRELLVDLNAENMGIKIEEFYIFLQSERARLRQKGIPPGSIAEAGKSATIISLFAFWLHPEQEPVVYYEETRRGLAWVMNKRLLTPIQELRIQNDIVVIHTNRDHQACQAAINELLTLHPSLKSSPYWSGYFFGWVANAQIVIVPKPANTNPPSRTFKNYKLAPTVEPLLTNLIYEVQRQIIVEESVVRRIYHALLAGHVILSGPPGTGKTELARLIPETLWKSAENGSKIDGNERLLSSETAYTTRLVTATDEWSVRTLIGCITPANKNGSVIYKIQDGYLTATIKKNWADPGDNSEEQMMVNRTFVTGLSGVKQDTRQTFRGLWLVIDEFNRAPIDLALGDALTALGGNNMLHVMTEDGSTELPIPKDFRIIGTLNSFDRNYLNQISEALKRRFSFIEILPPGRHLREAEQAMVLYKALDQVSHLRADIDAENELFPWDTLTVEADEEEPYIITWPDEPHPFREAFETAWRVFEVIRVYRQLGTAQAISLVRHMLIAGILQSYTTREQWIGQALDAALCDTIADQLQVLLPDEIDALLLSFTSEQVAFSAAYNRLLDRLVDRPQRLYGQLLALSSGSDEQGGVYLTDEQVEEIVQSNNHEVSQQKLNGIFHLDAPLYRLPQFIRRLRAFKSERGL